MTDKAKVVFYSETKNLSKLGLLKGICRKVYFQLL